MSDTYQRLASLLVKHCGLEADEVTPDATFRSLEVDSLALVELSLAAEQEFATQIGEDDLDLDGTVADAAAVITAKIAQGSGTQA
ncbi:acyl carrier protein [Streptomyces sp. ISL-11]|uniref:acyl carrier protein n=1 Tax=Streptomyces sp. ISL-11 TaxID=2819174 RepID=UPI001BE4EEF9|nr:acyl carrier protein [Streptomyces sp. ISL-11]MBT2384967.1 acyl carrier protein [Streptomyces sp. ISL-11]